MTDQLRTVDQSFDYPELVPLRGTEFLARVFKIGTDIQAETESLVGGQSPEIQKNAQAVQKAIRALIATVLIDATEKQISQLETESFSPSDPNIDLLELIEKTRQLIEVSHESRHDTTDWEARLEKVTPEAFRKELRNRVEALEALVDRNDERIEDETKERLKALLEQAKEAGVDQEDRAAYHGRIQQAYNRNKRLDRQFGRAWKQATSLFRKK